MLSGAHQACELVRVSHDVRRPDASVSDLEPHGLHRSAIFFDIEPERPVDRFLEHLGRWPKRELRQYTEQEASDRIAPMDGTMRDCDGDEPGSPETRNHGVAKRICIWTTLQYRASALGHRRDPLREGAAILCMGKFVLEGSEPKGEPLQPEAGLKTPGREPD